MISAEMKYTKKFTEVNGKSIAYVEEGEGDPIVLLHGNPTSSYLWRNIIPELEGIGRIIVPDLIGQGDSAKIPASEGADRYGFDVAYSYLDEFLKLISATDNVTLVLHDWGSGLGFHWANLHRDAVKGIAYMEAIVKPMEWDDWPEGARGIFKGFRSDKGEDLILNRNMFIEGVFPTSIIRDMSNEEMDAYRAPFLDPQDRQVMLNWPRQIPLGGEPADIVAKCEAYGEWLASDETIPKLFVNAEPGSILVGKQREFCRSWPKQTEVTVKGLHFVQEDSPAEIGQAIASWYRSI